MFQLMREQVLLRLSRHILQMDMEVIKHVHAEADIQSKKQEQRMIMENGLQVEMHFTRASKTKAIGSQFQFLLCAAIAEAVAAHWF